MKTVTDFIRESPENKPKEIPTGFEIDLSYEPTNEHSILTMQNHRVLSVGNMMSIVSKSGTGKSQICEALMSRWVDPNADAFGFEMQPPQGRDIIAYIDTERSRNDSHRGYLRSCRRIDDKYIQDNKINNVIWQSFKSISKVEDRVKAIENLILNYPIGFLIIDGITDLMLSANDEDKSIELLLWLTAIADRKDLAVLVTIHSSPSSAEDKPRGHIGSEIYRRCESMWKLTSDKDVKILETDFSFGKVRNDYNILTTSFTWDEDQKMFVSCDYVPEKKIKKIDYGQIFDDAFESELILSYNDLAGRIVEACGVSLPTAKRRIKDGTELKKIIKDERGNYRRVS